ncbi:hypothetical protein PPS11_35425 [Pseudomonas putida S11]|nr:hypothetical protein PPS11_35425 [Pseudomonas putida S11]
MQLRHDAFLLDQQGMQARPVDVLEAVAFQALGQRRGNCVDLADGIFGMLRRGPGQVGDHVLGIGEGVPVVAPDAPTFHHDEGEHHHQHEREYQAEQRHGPALAGYREDARPHPVSWLRTLKSLALPRSPRFTIVQHHLSAADQEKD